MNFDPDEIKTLLVEIAAAIESARFELIPSPPSTRAYHATSDGWYILVITFTRATDALPGCDGTATKRDTLVRLTPELARRSLELAEKQTLS